MQAVSVGHFHSFRKEVRSPVLCNTQLDHVHFVSLFFQWRRFLKKKCRLYTAMLCMPSTLTSDKTKQMPHCLSLLALQDSTTRSTSDQTLQLLFLTQRNSFKISLWTDQKYRICSDESGSARTETYKCVQHFFIYFVEVWVELILTSRSMNSQGSSLYSQRCDDFMKMCGGGLCWLFTLQLQPPTSFLRPLPHTPMGLLAIHPPTCILSERWDLNPIWCPLSDGLDIGI